MEGGKNPEYKDDEPQQDSVSPQSTEEPTFKKPSFVVKIPTKYLSEEQKKLFCQKPGATDEPSTSREDIFKEPQAPSLGETEASSDIAPTTLSTSVAQISQDISSDKSESQGDEVSDEQAKMKTQDADLN